MNYLKASLARYRASLSNDSDTTPADRHIGT